MADRIMLRAVEQRVDEIGLGYPMRDTLGGDYHPVVVMGVTVDAQGYIVQFLGVTYVAEGMRDKPAEILGYYPMHDMGGCRHDGLLVAKRLRLQLRTATANEGWKVLYDPTKSEPKSGSDL